MSGGDGGAPAVDEGLLERFRREILEKVPRRSAPDAPVADPTPMVDLTADVLECARSVYKMDLSDTGIRVLAKMDGGLPAGSIKMRPAAHIIHDAIATGRLRSGQAVIEATSGNFGIALGRMARLGIPVVALVSRRLQEGVFEELRGEGVSVIDLDMDVCPAPGMEGSRDAAAAKAAAANVRSQLAGLGFDPAPFDAEAGRIESLLKAQDVINLAKLLASAYGMFCPEQYDNALNVEAHRTVTGPEMDAQVGEMDGGRPLGDYEIVCAFGTGGTSAGLARYAEERHGARPVHVVFPKPGQDVAGIRTRDNAAGLPLYSPGLYAAEHEVDYEQAGRLLPFLVGRGRDVGESTALALYQVIRMAGFGGEGKRRFVVVAADGIAKYRGAMEAAAEREARGAAGRTRVSLREAASAGYGRVVWVHPQYAPREEGLEMLARSLGVEKSKITVASAAAVGELLRTRQVPAELEGSLEGAGGKSLLVCMAGNTSQVAADALARKGIPAESLAGGITGLPEGEGRHPGTYVKQAAV